MTKKSTGMFFKEASQSSDGHFLRDMSGRDDALFYSKTAMNGQPGTRSMNMGATGAPVGGMGSMGQGMSGGNLFGHGEGVEKKKPKGDEEERLKKLLAKSRDKNSSEKTAGATPSDWNAGSGIPTGFHRPTKEQPEALEDGGTRFHDSTADSPEYDSTGISHGVIEGGSLHLPHGSNHQMGKHAAPRFLGTSLGIEKQAKYINTGVESYTGDKAGKFVRSLKRGAKHVAGKADEAAEAVVGSPIAAGIATLLAARLGLRGVKGVARAIRGKRQPTSLVGSAVGSIKKLLR